MDCQLGTCLSSYVHWRRKCILSWNLDMCCSLSPCTPFLTKCLLYLSSTATQAHSGRSKHANTYQRTELPHAKSNTPKPSIAASAAPHCSGLRCTASAPALASSSAWHCKALSHANLWQQAALQPQNQQVPSSWKYLPESFQKHLPSY